MRTPRFARITILSTFIIVACAAAMIQHLRKQDRIAILPDPDEPAANVAIVRRPAGEVEAVPRRDGKLATVIRRDGKPLAGASVIEIQASGRLVVRDGVANVVGAGAKAREGRTGSVGTFVIPQYDRPWFVFILGDDSYASANEESLMKSQTIRARPYARVQGRYLVGTRPVPNQELYLNGWTLDPASLAQIFFQQKATTDPHGRFTFEKAIPDAGLRVARMRRSDETGRPATIGEPVHVEPGATAEVTLGGKGRPVIGRVELPEGWAKPVDFTVESEASLDSNRKIYPLPSRFYRGKTALGDDWSQWRRSWLISPEGRQYEADRFDAVVGLGRDGSFRIDDVPAGEYRLAIGVNGRRKFTHYVGHYNDPRPFARIIRIFTVAPIPGGRSNEPMDLGAMRLRPRAIPRVRDPAPAFEVTTVEGKTLAVPGDFRGKILLIDFGTMWDGGSGVQVTRLNAVNEKFGKDPRFAILSLTFAADNPETRKYVEEKGQTWPQAIVGPMENPISLAYGVNDETAPATVLIGPEGTIYAQDLWGDDIGLAVGKILRRADP